MAFGLFKALGSEVLGHCLGCRQEGSSPLKFEGETSRRSRLKALTEEGPVPAKRVQVPKILGLWFQKPYPEWYLGARALNIGYLDPLGGSSKSPKVGIRSIC